MLDSNPALLEKQTVSAIHLQVISLVPGYGMLFEVIAACWQSPWNGLSGLYKN